MTQNVIHNNLQGNNKSYATIICIAMEADCHFLSFNSLSRNQIRTQTVTDNKLCGKNNKQYSTSKELALTLLKLP